MADFRWRGDLEGNLKTMGLQNKRAMVVAGNAIAAESQAYMRSNANWQDQSGNARNGLKAQTIVAKNLVAVVLYHSVPYGIWLEVRWSGKYAIIMPTVEVMAPRYMALVAKMMFK